MPPIGMMKYNMVMFDAVSSHCRPLNELGLSVSDLRLYHELADAKGHDSDADSGTAGFCRINLGNMAYLSVVSGLLGMLHGSLSHSSNAVQDCLLICSTAV